MTGQHVGRLSIFPGVLRRRRPRPRGGLLVVCALALCPAAPRADQLLLSNGNRLRGVISRQDAEELEFLTLTSRLQISRRRVISIQPESGIENSFLRLQIELRGGGLAAIEAALKEYAAQSPRAERSWNELLEQREPLFAAFAAAAQAERETFLETFNAQFQAQPDSSLLQWLNYQFALRGGDRERAGRLLFEIPIDFLRERLSPAVDDKEFAGEIAEFRRRAFRLILERRLDAARDLVHWLNRLQPDSRRTEAGLLHIRQAAEFIADDRIEAGMKVYADELSPQYPATAALLIRLRAEEGVRRLKDQFRWEEALELCVTTIADFGEQLAVVTRAGIYRDWGKFELAAGNVAGARERLQQANALQPACADQELRAVDWVETWLRLDPNDPRALLDHAQLALREGLHPQARLTLEQARGFKEYMDEANALLRQLDTAEARRLFDEARREFRYNRYHRALDLIERIQRDFPDSDIREQVNQFERQTVAAMEPPLEKKEYPLADLEKLQELNLEFTINPRGMLQIEVRQQAEWVHRYQAELLLDEARKARAAAEYQRALDQLEQLFASYPGTAAAEEARPLQTELLAAWMLELLESGAVTQLPAGLKSYLPSLDIEVPEQQLALFAELREFLGLFE